MSRWRDIIRHNGVSMSVDISSTGRSPSYPFIPLGKALDRLAELKDTVGRELVSAAEAASCWGYGPKSSGGIQTTAALKQFGLLIEISIGNEKKLKISTAGWKTLSRNWLDNKRMLVKHALHPKIHRVLWDRYHTELPTDEDIISYLVERRGFNASGAKDLLNEYKDTLAFVELLDIQPEETEELTKLVKSVMANDVSKFYSKTYDPSDFEAPKHAAGDFFYPKGISTITLYDNRIRVIADVDLEGAKEMLKKLQKRIEILEEESGD